MLLIPLQRPRLISRINDPYLAPVTIITAPAGYGKSALAEQWARSRGHGVGLVTLHEESNTPERFLSQVLTAIRDAAPDCLLPAEEGPILDVIVTLLDSISRAGQDITLILDDYHLIENQDVHDNLNGYLPYMPKGIRVVILSRSQPPLALGRLRAHGHVRHLTEVDLRFTPDEVRDLVSDRGLSAEQTNILTSRTDGWIAGIQLALTSLGIPGCQPHEQFESAILSLSEQQWLNDYIVEEVLDRLPPDLRRFVFGTSMLTSLDPDLCNTVLGIDSSEAFLRDIVRRIVFVAPTSTPGSPLVYHRLFAECVQRISRRHFSPAERKDLHLRAARWYEHHARLELAIDHAISAEAWDQATRLVREVCESLINRDLQHSALFWLEKLPPPVRTRDDELAYWHVKMLLHTGQFHQAEEELKALRPRWSQSPTPLHRGYVVACDATFAVFDGKDDLALQLWYQTLHYIPTEKTIMRLHAWSLVHQFEFLRGNDDIAEHAFRQAVHCRSRLPQEQIWWTQHVQLDRANFRALRADLITAEQLYRHQLTEFPAAYRAFEAKRRYRLAAIYLEWNELDRALGEARQVEEDIAKSPLHAWHAEALLVVARVHLTCGDIASATRVLDQVFSIHNEYGGKNTGHRAWALQASLWLETGKPVLAREWADQHQNEVPEWERTFGEGDIRATRLHILVAEGAPEEASKLAQRCIEGALRINHLASLITFHVWEAVAQVTMGNEAAALESLRIAIQHGSKGNFVRSLHPLGHHLRPLLARIRTGLSPDEISYGDRILASLLDSPSPCAKDTPAISVPLTTREREVLALLHDGYTNQDIAERLFITERTAKKHVGNILAKLDVSNRTSAIARARKVGLVK